MDSQATKREVICEGCGLKFFTGWSEEDAEKEYQEAFTEQEREDDRVLVCDDCYNKFIFHKAG